MKKSGGDYAETAAWLANDGREFMAPKIMAHALVSIALNLDRIANLMEFYLLPMKETDD